MMGSDSSEEVAAAGCATGEEERRYTAGCGTLPPLDGISGGRCDSCAAKDERMVQLRCVLCAHADMESFIRVIAIFLLVGRRQGFLAQLGSKSLTWAPSLCLCRHALADALARRER